MNQISPTLSAAPMVSAKSARIVAGLATLYYRHNDPARALALGLMALRCGSDVPKTAMLVASCFLKTGDAEQAAAALSRLESLDLSPAERSAARFLAAKVAFRQGDDDAARRLMLEAASNAAGDI